MISDLEDQPTASEQRKLGLVQEYWQVSRTFSPSVRRLLISAAMGTTAFIWHRGGATEPVPVATWV